MSSKQVENTGVIAERWKVWYKLNFARNYIIMTTPGPRLNNESEPMCFFGFFSSSSKELCDVSHVAVSLQFPNCPEWFVMRCHHGLKRKKRSGIFFFFFYAFAMPCDLRKKAALTNFLRDIRLCLMFVFVSVIPLFFYYYYTVLTKIWTL